MNILRISIYGLFLGVLFGFLPRAEAQGVKDLFCYPTENGVVCFDRPASGPPHYDCQYLNEVWKTWRAGGYRSSTFEPTFFLSLKDGCPKGAGSIDYLAAKFKEYQEKEKKAQKHVEKTVETITYGPRCPPGMWGLIGC
jgi:hypothetical protein